MLAKLKAAAAEKQQQEVAEDLQIMIRRVDLNFRREDFERAHEVPFINASQVMSSAACAFCSTTRRPNERRPAAVVRIREYAGTRTRLHRDHGDPEAALPSRWRSRA